MTASAIKYGAMGPRDLIIWGLAIVVMLVAPLIFSSSLAITMLSQMGIAIVACLSFNMVYLTGYGFPLHRGGPMNYADQVGLFNVVQAMKRFQKNPRDDAAFWEPAPLLAKLAAEGKTFS